MTTTSTRATSSRVEGEAPAPTPERRRPRPAARHVVNRSHASSARMTAWLIGVSAGLALFFVLFLVVLSPLQQSRSQSVLYTHFRSELGAATAPFGVHPIDSGAPVALIDVPSLGMRQVIVEGTSGSDLRSGPGHFSATPLPGQLGTSVIFGRSTTYGGPFGDLTKLQPGAALQVTTGQGLFSYRVEDVRSDGDPQPPALKPSQSRLLLVTTTRGTLGALETVYVDAMLTSDSAPTPPHSVLPVPQDENEMASDPSGLLPLALWLLVLMGGGAFAAWGLARWGKAQTWLIAAPILFVALWGASDNAALLLPNLM